MPTRWENRMGGGAPIIHATVDDQDMGQLPFGNNRVARGDDDYNGGVKPSSLLVGIVVAIVILKLIGESPGTSISPAHIHVGGYNAVTVLLISLAGTALLKFIANRYPAIPAVTDFINYAA